MSLKVMCGSLAGCALTNEDHGAGLKHQCTSIINNMWFKLLSSEFETCFGWDPQSTYPCWDPQSTYPCWDPQSTYPCWDSIAKHISNPKRGRFYN